ncbi:MAG: nucleoside triphosphate pyrophosphohydrolase [Proteobacteria bacterium]|nr:nucleoside triphosphate pyrophosphohydrolase [Pseudomonadota bacterium]
MQNLQRLLKIMSDLRDPKNGCPWDLKQSYQSLVKYTLEEAYEVAEAIESGDMKEVKKELGDLLFQIVFYAQLAKEEGLFDFDDIACSIADKMVIRHPHVFSDHHYENEEAFLKAWEEQKEKEKSALTSSDENLKKESMVSLMDGISQILPAMPRAVKIQQKAIHIGFDLDSAEQVLPKIRGELDKLLTEIKAYEAETNKVKNIEKIENELGDVLFSCVNLARKLEIDPERALRLSNHKFTQRFRKMEAYYQYDRKKMESVSIIELNKIWQKL